MTQSTRYVLAVRFFSSLSLISRRLRWVKAVSPLMATLPPTCSAQPSVLCTLDKYVLLMTAFEEGGQVCFPRGLLGLELGETWGDLIRSFIQQIFIEHLLCAWLSEWLRQGLCGGRESCVSERPPHLEKGGVLSRPLLGEHLYLGI